MSSSRSIINKLVNNVKNGINQILGYSSSIPAYELDDTFADIRNRLIAQGFNLTTIEAAYAMHVENKASFDNLPTLYFQNENELQTKYKLELKEDPIWNDWAILSRLSWFTAAKCYLIQVYGDNSGNFLKIDELLSQRYGNQGNLTREEKSIPDSALETCISESPDQYRSDKFLLRHEFDRDGNLNFSSYFQLYLRNVTLNNVREGEEALETALSKNCGYSVLFGNLDGYYRREVIDEFYSDTGLHMATLSEYVNGSHLEDVACIKNTTMSINPTLPPTFSPTEFTNFPTAAPSSALLPAVGSVASYVIGGIAAAGAVAGAVYLGRKAYGMWTSRNVNKASINSDLELGEGYQVDDRKSYQRAVY